jgi:hypothetical protein
MKEGMKIINKQILILNMKNLYYCFSLRNCKLKEDQDTTAHLLQKLNSKEHYQLQAKFRAKGKFVHC